MPKQAKSTKQPPAPKVVKITLVRSPIGFNYRQKRTVYALGLRRLHQTVEHVDAPTLRGMIAKVSHLVRVEEG